MYATGENGNPGIRQDSCGVRAHRWDPNGESGLTFLLDGDEAGRSAAHAIMEQLCRQPFRVKFTLLPEGAQPDTVDIEYLRELLGLRD